MTVTLEQVSEMRAVFKAEQSRRITENRLAHYRPYPKQREFHRAGAMHRERLLMAGNQLGKTTSGAAETAIHLTGRYPDWWDGRVLEGAIHALAGSESAELTRDGVQRLLVGPPRDESLWGTGLVPKECLLDWSRKQGVPDALDGILVRHGGGGDVQASHSSLNFKSYDQGRTKWQADKLSVVWFDEEPPLDIYTEGLTRTNVGEGPVYMTFTPLQGMSDTVRRFLLERSDGRHVTSMTIEDAEHFSPEERARIIASYPAHERDARTKGVPQLGSGRIFPVLEETVTCPRREIPKYWRQLGAMDFGWDHPFAAVELAHDLDHDVVYVTRTYRVREAAPVMHAAALKPWGKLRWAWPKDGGRETLEGAGIALAEQYRRLDLDMLHTHAQFEPEPGKQGGSISVEAGLMEMLTRMQTGRFKVFADLLDWFEEFRLYHRKDGKVVKIGDDLMSATRYGVMMLRYAELTTPPPRQGNPHHALGPDAWML